MHAAEGSTEEPEDQGLGGSTGVVERGMCARGHPRNLRGLVSFPTKTEVRANRRSSRLADVACRPARAGGKPRETTKRGTYVWVPRNEGNEVKRDGRREVGGARSTEEVGELAPRGPDGGKETPGTRNRERERCLRH